MKRIRLMLIVVLLFILFGCHKIVEYHFLQSEENIARIEIVRIENDDNIPILKSDPFVHVLLVEIPQDKIDDFIGDFTHLLCYEYFSDPGSIFPNDMAIKITYNNDDYELISEDAQATFQKNKFKGYGYYYFDHDDFIQLLAKYSN